MGMDAVSDDEEDGDGTRPYQVKTLAWRNPDIARFMEFIDARYYLAKKKTGNTLRRRARTGNRLSARPPVLNLPKWFYNDNFAPLNTLTIDTDNLFSISTLGLSNTDGLTDDMIRERRARGAVF
jgi:hypothetical protein